MVWARFRFGAGVPALLAELLQQFFTVLDKVQIISQTALPEGFLVQQTVIGMSSAIRNVIDRL
jgi:hypothetical protein